MRKLYHMYQLDAEHRNMLHEICKKYMCDTCPLRSKSNNYCITNCDPIMIEDIYESIFGSKNINVDENDLVALFRGNDK